MIKVAKASTVSQTQDLSELENEICANLQALGQNYYALAQLELKNDHPSVDDIHRQVSTARGYWNKIGTIQRRARVRADAERQARGY